MERTKNNRFWLTLSAALMLLAGIVGALVQTSTGKVSIKDMRWETRSGELLSALLYKPASATVEHPAPAVVVSHGWWNNREIQSPIALELARRGYVVVSIDMYGHGSSEPLHLASITGAGTGMYDAVRLVAELPYVDKTRIGVAGHSHGARACNYSVAADNEQLTRLIAAVMLVDSEPFYSNTDGKYANVYGSRHVGLVADRYDEFCFRTFGSCGQVLTTPRQYIGTSNAQSFLHFGAEPSAVKDQRIAGQTYSQDGVMRVIYSPNETHPWGLISQSTVGMQLAFFEKALGAPNPIPADSQIWQVKHLFSTIGLLGFGIFLVATARVLWPSSISNLKSPISAKAQFPYGQEITLHRKGSAWFWFGLTLCAIFSAFSYVWVSNTAWIRGVTFNSFHTIFPQGKLFFVAFWLAVNGLAGLVIMTACYALFGHNSGQELRSSGLLPGWKNLFAAIWIGAVVVATGYGFVFVLNYFFKTDLRCWLISVKAFTPDKLGLAFRCLPLMAVYFFANSILINCFNPRQNMVGLIVFNILGPAVLLIAQYTVFFRTGDTIPGFDPIFSVWLIPVVAYLAASVIISQKLYRASGNPYLGGFINAAVVTLIVATNTLTVMR